MPIYNRFFFSKSFSYGRQIDACLGKNDINTTWLVYIPDAVTHKKSIVNNIITIFWDYLVKEEGNL